MKDVENITLPAWTSASTKRRDDPVRCGSAYTGSRRRMGGAFAASGAAA